MREGGCGEEERKKESGEEEEGGREGGRRRRRRKDLEAGEKAINVISSIWILGAVIDPDLLSNGDDGEWRHVNQGTAGLAIPIAVVLQKPVRRQGLGFTTGAYSL